MSRWKCAIWAVILLFIVISMIILLFSKEVSVFTFAAGHSDSPLLIIDAGHGGEDGGAVSLTGMCESNINLSIARRLDGALTLVGYPTHMLRTTDISLHDPDAVTLRQKKVSDLHNRAEAVQSHPNAVLISIHQNSYPGSQYSGAQVFYSRFDRSRALAEYIQQTFVNAIDPNNKRQVKQIPDSIYLFQHVSCPAVLVECGFLTNAREDKLLQQPGYQNKLAVAIAASYLSYLAQ